MTESADLLEALCARFESPSASARLSAALSTTSVLDALWLVSIGLWPLCVSDGDPASAAVANTRPSSGPDIGQRAALAEGMADRLASRDTREHAVEASLAAARALGQEPRAAPAEQPPAECGSAAVDEAEMPLAYARVHAGGQSLGTAQRVQIASAVPLGRRLRLERAFAAMRTRRATTNGEVELDYEGTIEQFAATRRMQAIWRKRRGRWLDLAIVVERSPSMRFWQATASHLVPVVERGMGARRTHVYFLRHDAVDGAAGETVLTDRRARQRALDVGSSDGMVIFLTDALGTGWISGGIPAQLARWSAHRPVIVMQMLPTRFWSRTALANVLPLPAWRRSGSRRGANGRPPVPLLSHLDVEPVRKTMRALAGRGRSSALRLYGRSDEPQWTPEDVALQFRGDEMDALDDDALFSDEPYTPAEIDALWNDFRHSATPSTQRLASYLAAAPLVMPVMRMIERALVPDAAPWQIAELAMSGLICRWVNCLNTEIERMEYEFLPGIRERLLQDAGELRRRQVVRLLTDYVGRRFGRAREFEAYCAGSRTPTADDATLEYLPFLRLAQWHGARASNGAASARDAAATAPEPTSTPTTAVADADRDVSGRIASSETRFVPLSLPCVVADVIRDARASGHAAPTVKLSGHIDSRISPHSVGDALALRRLLGDVVDNTLRCVKTGYVGVLVELLRPKTTRAASQLLRISVQASVPAWALTEWRAFDAPREDFRDDVDEGFPVLPTTLDEDERAQFATRVSTAFTALGVSRGCYTTDDDEMPAVWMQFELASDSSVSGAGLWNDGLGIGDGVLQLDALRRYWLTGAAARDASLRGSSGQSREIENERARRTAIRVLAAIGDPTLMPHVSEALMRLHVKTDLAGTVEAAVERADKQRYDLVLADFDLILSARGLLADRVHRRESPSGRDRTPIIAFGERLTSELATKLDRAGVDDAVAYRWLDEALEPLLTKWVPAFDSFPMAEPTRPPVVDASDLQNRAAAKASPPVRAPSRSTVRQFSSGSESLSVLVVEPEEARAQGVFDALSHVDVHAELVDNEVLALTRLAASRTDMVLLDLDRPLPMIGRIAHTWQIIKRKVTRDFPLVVGVTSNPTPTWIASLGIDVPIEYPLSHGRLTMIVSRRRTELAQLRPKRRAKLFYLREGRSRQRIDSIWLESHGFEVVEAQRDLDAEEKAKSGPYDLTLVEWNVDRSVQEIDMLRLALRWGGSRSPVFAVVDWTPLLLENANEFDGVIVSTSKPDILKRLKPWMAPEESRQQQGGIDVETATEVLDALLPLAAHIDDETLPLLRKVLYWDHKVQQQAFARRMEQELQKLHELIEAGRNDESIAIAYTIGAACKVMGQPRLARRAEALVLGLHGGTANAVLMAAELRLEFEVQAGKAD